MTVPSTPPQTPKDGQKPAPSPSGRAGIEREESPGKPNGGEPEIAFEEDIPSDGRDHEGEAEIRKLPSRPELSDKPDRLNN